MKRGLLVLLLWGVLLTAAGCGRTDPPPTPAAPTAGSEPASSAARPEGTDPTVPLPTDPIDPTLPTTAPTKSADPAKREWGTPSFTLAGQTFIMGESPDRLLAFLGEPEERYSYGDNLFDGTDHFYHYKDVWVTAFQPTGSDDSLLTDVYFITDKYAFDGLSVGSSAADLRRAVSLPESDPEAAAYPLFRYEEFQMHTEIGGWGYRLDREQEAPGDTYWVFLFTREEDPEKPAEDAPILCIHLCYVYPFATQY